MRGPTVVPERQRGTEMLGQENSKRSQADRGQVQGQTRHLRRQDGHLEQGEKMREKQQPQKYPALLLPACTLTRASAPAPSPHALVPHDASAFPHSTARARTRRCPQEGEAAAQLPALPQALGTTSAAPSGAQRRKQPHPAPPPATSPAWPRRHGFPSLCPSPASQRAARVGAGITDRRHQPITARQRAVPGTRALLNQAPVGRRAGSRGAGGGCASWGGGWSRVTALRAGAALAPQGPSRGRAGGLAGVRPLRTLC